MCSRVLAFHAHVHGALVDARNRDGLSRLREAISGRLALRLLGFFVALTSALVFVSAAAASITEFTIPTAVSSPSGITAGPDGALWFTEQNGAVNQIGRLTTTGSFKEFGGLSAPRPSYLGPGGITAGPDGRLWFTEIDANKIGAITTDGV